MVEKWRAAHRAVRFYRYKYTQPADHSYWGHDGSLYLEESIRNFKMVTRAGAILSMPVNWLRFDEFVVDILNRVEPSYEGVITKVEGGKGQEVDSKFNTFTSRIALEHAICHSVP